jgi:predicted phage terminase large subunit-like protein
VNATAWEFAARAFEAPTRTYPTPGALAQALDPRVKQTPALELIDRALVDALDADDGRLVISMPPQEGKSQRASRWFPLWALEQYPDLRIAVVSYELGVARRWGRVIRDDITMNPGLGLRVRDDLAAQHEWQLAGHDGGVYSAGIGGALTGRPVDLLIVDDPFKDRVEADSLRYRQRAWDWWTDVGGPRLAPGATVVVIQTRWHEDDLTGRLLDAEDGDLWTVVNIPAQADHDPARGETDPLGRAPGEYMRSARGRSVAQWEAIKVRSGSRTWNALYQGRPSPAEGGVWQRSWWTYYDNPIWVERPDGSRFVPRADGGGILIQSWDMAFKATSKSDFVVGQVWFTDGVHAYLLDQVHARLAFPDTARAVVAMTARWPQAALKLVEDKANGPAVIAALQRRVPGLVAEEPHGSKESRAQAVAPFIEAGNVHLPHPNLAPWVGDLVEEAAAFPNGAHDDQVDATSQALTRLLLTPMLTGTPVVTQDDVDDDVADYRITDY